MKQRIGVYICHCGGNISDYVDVEEISKMLKEENGVVISKDVMFACADSNQKAMIQDIKEYNLDAIVVASCSPKLHLHTFRNVAERAELNPNNYVQVNIREQCSWPHHDHPKEATVKAVGLIRAGINRVAHSEALENIEITAKRAVAVIGAGVAGMRAALDLARMGNEVYLLEKDFFVGGHIAQNNNLFVNGGKGKDIIKKLYDEIKAENKITLFTGANIEKVSGSIGNFSIDIKLKPRCISWKKDGCNVEQAMSECPAEIPDTFNLGLTKRKALYKNYPEALPDIPVADAEALKDHKEYLQKYANCIDITQREEHINLIAGAILVATGYENYSPKEGEFGYKQIPNIITLPEFNRLLELSKDELIINNKKIKTVAYIYCVGNRQTKGENKYCSRMCCSAAIQNSITIKTKFKNIKSYHLFRDIRTYGKQELLYEQSSKQGDVYIRYEEKEPPVISQNNNAITIKVKDYLTAKKELELDVDLVVLVTGMVARSDSTQISELFKIPIGNDKFFNEIHPKLKPVETVIKGVFIGGSCQGPKNITESVQSSMAAAAKINMILKEGKIQIDPIIAEINAEICTWCGKCAEVCEYGAIKQQNAGNKIIAVVNKATCAGCGICAPVCPVDAINLANFTNAEIEGMIDGFLTKVEITESDKNSIQQEEEETAIEMKEYPQIWKNILTAINGSKKTIPEIVQQTGLPTELITYHLMTMNKYGIILPDGMDKKEQYYYYTTKK